MPATVCVVDGKKLCADCGETKPVEDFPTSKSNSTGYNSWCKVCTRKRKNASEAKRRTEMGEEAYLARRLSYKKKYGAKFPERVARTDRHQKLKKFGYTIEMYERMYEEQDGKCLICGMQQAVLHADHDHATGLPRALLCSNHNTGLGLFQDSPEILRLAANYVERFRAC
jgi:hypothetical protein